ncbi:RNA polymerase subunit sigma [Sorangium cellulosum]|uniref:RNA polymerase subunit sigma n=1 Tax=Sorangium cellulosum TaxID=56 RepID=A0A150SM29_SORCE|nr:RNA polymerase subunit sigma [Sorangium cellulosum]
MGKPAIDFADFDRYRRLARRRGVPAQSAEDVAQDALLRGLEADQRTELGVDPAPYHTTIVLNRARNHIRDARRRGEVLTSFDDHELRSECPTPEELLRLRQREKVLRDLIGRIDPGYRALLIKHELEEIPLSEIAAQLELPLATVRTQHRRGWEQLELAARRWRAQRRSRGHEETPCVPLTLGLYRRASRPAWLRRLGVRILVQGAIVVLTGALVAAVPPLPSLEPSRLRTADRAPGTAPVAQDVAAAGVRDGVQAAATPATPATDESSSLAGGTSARTEAMVSSKPVPLATTRPRASSPASAVQSAVNERERSLIRDARRAVEAHEAMADLEARRLLEAHAREFPQGQLAAEREEMLRQLR